MSASNIRVGQLLRLTVRFADFDHSTGTDELFDPTSVSLLLYKYNSTTLVWDLISALGPVIHDAIGIYHYDWTTPSDGKFKLIYTGTTPGATPSTVTDTRTFYVGTAVPTTILTNTLNYYFLGELSPLYLDPDEITRYLPDVDPVDVTESIYRASLELEEWFGPNVVVTSLMYDYLVAATLCDLSKTYLIGDGLNGFTNDFTLGDLSVKTGSGNGGSGLARGQVYAGNASSWCELAFALKDELLKSKVTFFPVVKGSAFANPIPCRKLRKFD